MELIIRVGDIIEAADIGYCEVTEIQSDGVVALTGFGNEYIPCSKIVGCIHNE